MFAYAREVMLQSPCASPHVFAPHDSDFIGFAAVHPEIAVFNFY